MGKSVEPIISIHVSIDTINMQKGYGFLYKLIEEQFIGNIEPYIEDWIKRSEGMRTQLCSTTVLLLASAQRSVNKMLLKSTEDKHLYYLAKAVKKTLSDITKEQALREKRKSSSSDRGATMPSDVAAAANKENKSIFEEIDA